MPINQSAVAEVDDQDITPASVDTDGSVTAGSVTTDDATFPVETPDDISGSRTFATWFQNTTGKPLFLLIRVDASNSSNAFRIDCILDVNSSQAGNSISYFRAEYEAGEGGRMTHTAIVPDDGYYRLRSFGDGSIGSWSEQEVGTE